MNLPDLSSFSENSKKNDYMTNVINSNFKRLEQNYDIEGGLQHHVIVVKTQTLKKSS